VLSLTLPRRFVWALVILTLAVAADLTSSYLGLQRTHALEANPINALFLTGGFATLVVSKLLGLVVALVFALYLLRFGTPLLLRLYLVTAFGFAILLFVTSLSNFSAAFFGLDFLNLILRR
jgi:hypothetical protein